MMLGAPRCYLCFATVSGVCSLCTRLELRGHIVHTIISKTLEAGNSGPAVSLWVVHCLLGIAEAECNRTNDANEVRAAGAERQRPRQRGEVPIVCVLCSHLKREVRDPI